MEFKSVFKTTLYSVAVVGVLAMVSCGNADVAHITTGDAKKAVEQLDALKNDVVAELSTGYYEMNNVEYRYKLRQLAANELITYKAEQINEYKTSYWRGEYVEEHVFVTVELTDKGRKFIAEQVGDAEEDFFVDYTKFPEYNVAQEESITLLNPRANEGSEVVATTVEEENHEEAFQPDNTPVAPATTPKDMLEEARAKLHSETVTVTAYRMKVTEISDLKCTEEMWSRGEASCEVKVEVDNATPFGRILLGVYDGMSHTNNVRLEYFIDKGWSVDE